MIMDNNTRGQNSPPSYLDGISVKIAEKYKPPKRISLALSYSQRLTLNKMIQEPAPGYDFSLEQAVKSRASEWRKARQTVIEERKLRLQQVQEEQRKMLSEKATSDSEGTSSSGGGSSAVPAPDATVSTSAESQPQHQPAGAYYSSESGLLIPTSVASQQPSAYPINKDAFNFSEFESDTSSPFDNMELKTINDLEELAQVLRHDTDQVAVPVEHKKYTSYGDGVSAPTDSGYSSKYLFRNNIPLKYQHQLLASNAENQKNGFYFKNFNLPSYVYAPTGSLSGASPMLLALGSVVGRGERPPNRTAAPNQSEETLENPFSHLTPELQQMARKISSMGFPLSRVSRTCQALNGDQKKVVEHLLALTDLLDLGFPEQEVASALLKCNNDRDKALDLLIS